MVTTEQEWLKCNDPVQMIDLLEDAYSDRKLRLWGCASLRLVWSMLKEESFRDSVIFAEDFADCLASEGELEKARAEAQWTFEIVESIGLSQAEYDLTLAAASITNSSAFQGARSVAECTEINGKLGSALCRDIFGNPFRPVLLDPRWLSSTVFNLASTIYDERVWERMPILGDALMDAGCDSDEIIQHCQGPGPHVRGCWVVDLLLGKT